MSVSRLPVAEISRSAFAPFGNAITARDAELRLINNGTTQRFHDLADIDVAGENPRVLASLFRGQPFVPPIPIAMMERHPLGSQAFIPLHQRPWLVVVAPDENGKPGQPLCFLVRPDEHGIVGVNYARNVWHHPLISLEAESDFLVIDRGGPGENLEEHHFETPYEIAAFDKL